MAKNFILKGFLLLQLVQAINADGHVNIQVQILQYDNPLGTSFHGMDINSQRKCCDRGTIPTCSTTDTCDSIYVFCIGGFRSGRCIGPNITTSVLNNKASFGTSFDNTVIHSITWDHWQSSSLEYVANVMDKDGQNNELVDTFTSTIALRSDTDYESSFPQVLSFKRYVSLDVAIRIWCQDGYYGPDCSRKCNQQYSICTKNNGQTLLQSCSRNDVSTYKLKPGFHVPENFTPPYIRQLLSQFFLREICLDAHEVNVELLRFNMEWTLEFKAECDNKTISSLLFNTHIYILSLTNKAALGRYFPNIPLLVPTVHQQLARGAMIFVMLRPIHYHDPSTSCGHNGCNVHIQVCLKANTLMGENKTII
ncbi:uncharacterized protein LOC132732163 [Ruditapes philippinarum]|uniref:uncharacterized protein LOC132732163 n=1 Tax=Ruditapes philippinarum TaxID=129788 RepID=UPI00295B93A0|nr:uncharacterized protein LOC132732163 [Ruditapes philippinarum]